MKKWMFATMVALLVLSLALAGCGATPEPKPEPTEAAAAPTEAPAPEPTEAPAAEPEEEGGLKVGMVSDVGGIDDASFNENTWHGLEMAQEELGVQSQFIESQAQADYEKNITEFAEQGYDLIFTVGFLLGDATAKMAEVYPDTNMAIIDFAYDPPIPNVAGIVFNVDEAAFPIGLPGGGLGGPAGSGRSAGGLDRRHADSAGGAVHRGLRGRGGLLQPAEGHGRAGQGRLRGRL